jgi:transcriptional regulator with PAS, ATPase and Fis domain
MSPVTQIQLLRVIQEGTFERLGESVTRKVDVRIIAATNKNLKQAIEKGEFREDLYFRLNVVPIYVPPLRDRKEDIPLLVNFFLKNFSLLYKKNIYEIDDRVMDCLMAYDWPGNVRELENAIEYMFIRSRAGQILTVDKLPPGIKFFQKRIGVRPPEKNGENLLESNPFLMHREQHEKQLIRTYLEKFQWNRSKVAKALNMGRTTLWRKMKKYGLI